MIPRAKAKPSVAGALLLGLVTLVLAGPSARAEPGEADGRRTVSPAAMMRRTIKDLQEMRRLGRHELRHLGRGNGGLHAHLSGPELKATFRAYKNDLARISRTCGFLAHAAPSKLSPPRIVIAAARLAPSADGVDRLQLALVWLQRAPGVDGVVVFHHGKPRWKLPFCTLLREYEVDLARQQYDCSGQAQFASSLAKGYHRPALPGWRTLPARHPRYWASWFYKPLRQSWVPVRPGTGLWRFLRRRCAAEGHVTIALSHRGKIVSKALRIPVLARHPRLASERPRPKQLPTAPPQLALPVPIPPDALPWQKLQILAYDHVWFHENIQVPHWRRRMAINYLTLSAIPNLLPEKVRQRLNLRGSPYPDAKRLPPALLQRLAAGLKADQAAPTPATDGVRLGRYAGRILTLWRAVRFLRHAPRAALRLPRIVYATGYVGRGSRDAAVLGLAYLCSRQIPAGALSVAVLRHGKVYLTIAPWKALPNAFSPVSSEKGNVPAARSAPMPMAAFFAEPGPDCHQLLAASLRHAPTPAAERRHHGYLRHFFKTVPVNRRLFDYLRSRVGGSVRVGLEYKGKLMKGTVRASVFKGVAGGRNAFPQL